MGWQDQGRQEHGEWGNGTEPITARPDLDTRIRGMAVAAIAALPRGLRGHAAASFSDDQLERLTEAMRSWIGGLGLLPKDFADRFFHRDADDPAVAHLRAAAQVASRANTPAELREGTEHLAAAMQAVGLDRWNGFLGRVRDLAVALPRGQAASAANNTPSPAGHASSPTDPVVLTDDQGHPVLTPDGKPILRPAGLDPHMFVQRGLAAAKVADDVLRYGVDGAGTGVSATAAIDLLNFMHSGAWDAQRLGGGFNHDFIDYATVAIGLYAAAAGIPESEILSIQNDFAYLRSNFKNLHADQFDPVYKSLPKVNVANTHLGYELYQNGRIRPTTDAK